jgi:integrase
MAVPDDAEWRFGHCSATPGGEWLAEIFLRDPQMRGIDGGCEAIEPKMLPDDLDPYLRGRGYAIRSIACNQYAEDTAAAGTRIVRGHRDQIEVDTSDRRRVDYEREERRRNPSAGPSNLHLVVRDTVRDATRDSPRPVCPPKKEEDGPKDPKFAEAGANLRDFVEKGRGIVSGELPDGRVGAAIGALDALSSADQNLGAMNTRLHQANAVAQLIKLTADEIYGVQGGEKPKFADLVGGIDHVATLTGNAYMESAVKGFKVGFKVQELALKRQQGLPIETKDLKEVIEALNEFRGDRFKGLGELLDGVSKGIDKIVKVEELVKDLEGIAQLLDLAQQGRNDPQKALEAFGQYLDLLARAAGYVPGMGEFAKQYAEAVKSLQTSAATIGEAVAARNEAIRMAGEAIDGYDYDRLAQELAQFQGDVGEPPATGTALTADQVNLMAISADERQALDAATDEWSRVQDCVRTSATQLIALRGLYDGLRDEFNGLPPQAQLVDELDQAYFRAVYRDYLDKDANWRPDAAQSNRIGADSPNAALLELQSITSVQADQAINEARSRANFREWARARAKGLVDEMKATRSRLEECNKQLVALEQAYWQALRDYLAESSYWSAFVAQGRSLEAAAKARAEALAQIDQHIAARGFRIAGARIELVVATQCIEEKTVIGVGR